MSGVYQSACALLRVRNHSSTLESATIANSVGLLLILAIQYAAFFRTGTVYWTAEWLFASLLFDIFP
jgi:hypothetical protein